MTIEQINEIIKKNDTEVYQDNAKRYEDVKNTPNIVTAEEYVWVNFSNPSIIVGENNETLNYDKLYPEYKRRNLYDSATMLVPIEELKQTASNLNCTNVTISYGTNYYSRASYCGSYTIFQKSLKISELDNLFGEGAKTLQKK